MSTRSWKCSHAVNFPCRFTRTIPHTIALLKIPQYFGALFIFRILSILSANDLWALFQTKLPLIIFSGHLGLSLFKNSQLALRYKAFEQHSIFYSSQAFWFIYLILPNRSLHFIRLLHDPYKYGLVVTPPQ